MFYPTLSWSTTRQYVPQGNDRMQNVSDIKLESL